MLKIVRHCFSIEIRTIRTISLYLVFPRVLFPVDNESQVFFPRAIHSSRDVCCRRVFKESRGGIVAAATSGWEKENDGTKNNGNDHSLVGHEPPVGLVERSHFHAVTGDHAPAVVRRTGPRHVRARLRHGNRGSAGRRVRRSCNANKTHVSVVPVDVTFKKAAGVARENDVSPTGRLENTTDYYGTVTLAINALSAYVCVMVSRTGEALERCTRDGVFITTTTIIIMKTTRELRALQNY